MVRAPLLGETAKESKDGELASNGCYRQERENRPDLFLIADKEGSPPLETLMRRRQPMSRVGLSVCATLYSM